MDFHYNPAGIRQWSRSDACRDAFLHIGDEIHQEFQRTAPRRTGNLAVQSVVIPQMTPDGWGAMIQAQMHYAEYVEDGNYRDTPGKGMKGQYHLRNALRKVAS